MEEYKYTSVETKSFDTESNDTAEQGKYLLRQLFVSTGTWMICFCFGLCLGSPTVLIPQLRRQANSTDAVSIETASWLSSTFGYSGLVSAIIFTLLAQHIGRKIPFLIVCVMGVIGFSVFYFSTTITQLLISEVILGPVIATPVTISVMILTEYSSPRYRGVFMTLKSATFVWGIWVANTIGTFMHWKNIGILALACCTYALLTTLFWPESPYWLASKNRSDDCAASHRWLKGVQKESETELEKLIQSRGKIKLTTQSGNCISNILKMFASETFYRPILISMTVISLYHFSGKIACGMYALDILKKITGSESTAYTGMLVLDGITVLGMCVGCGLSKIVRRRSLLLVSSSIGVLFLFSISLYLYLVSYEIIFENKYLSVSLLTGYSLSISVGPMLLSTTVKGEVLPLKYRSSAVLVLGCFANLLIGGIVKITPFIIKYVQVRGLFLFFAVTSLFFITVTYKIQPETKDKTLLEIQESLLKKKKINESDELNCR